MNEYAEGLVVATVACLVTASFWSLVHSRRLRRAFEAGRRAGLRRGYVGCMEGDGGVTAEVAELSGVSASAFLDCRPLRLLYRWTGEEGPVLLTQQAVTLTTKAGHQRTTAVNHGSEMAMENAVFLAIACSRSDVRRSPVGGG